MQVPTANDVSVIICAYTEKRWDDLVAAIAAQESQTTPVKEVIVVIDHNDDLYHRALTSFPQIIVLQNTQERGLSGARNTGIAQATGEIIAFLDEDAVPESNWAETLITHYADPQVLGAGGQIKPLWLSGQPRWFPDEFGWVVGCTYIGMPKNTAPVRNLIGCNMSFRREIFDAVGTFRNGIGRVGVVPVGCEETELCIRVQQHYDDATLLYDPKAIVNHRVPDSRANWSYFYSRCYSEGKSKALISEFVGTKDSLSSERTYMLKTLPTGVFNGILATVKGDGYGLLRSYAIVAGLFVTGIGYLRAKYITPILTPATTDRQISALPNSGNQ